MCQAESSKRVKDCRAQLDVITNRWRRAHRNRSRYRDPDTNRLRGWRWLDMLREYSSFADPRPHQRAKPLTDRQLELRAAKWEDIPVTVRAVVLAWGEGKRDGQPWCKADHFGSKTLATDKANRKKRGKCWVEIKKRCGVVQGYWKEVC